MMHVLMMSMYAAITATVLASVESGDHSTRERVLHGLKVFGGFMVIGLILSFLLYKIPW